MYGMKEESTKPTLLDNMDQTDEKDYFEVEQATFVLITDEEFEKGTTLLLRNEKNLRKE